MSEAISGDECPARLPLPGVAALTRATNKKEAERRQAHKSNLRISGCGSAPTLTLPRMRGREWEGAARLPAFHRGACGSDRTPPLSPSYALPGTELVRSGCYPLPAVHSTAGDIARRPVVVPAGRCYPEPPGSGADEAPPAGTALAPPAGVTGRRPLRERD
jgi:hypothetical protein